jgi:hypothetical protein
MSKNNKKEAIKIENVNAGPGASDAVDFNDNDFVSNLDQDLINELNEKLEDKKSEIRTKVYAVSCTKEIFSLYRDFVIDKAEWNSTEALGIIQINKEIQKIEKEGIKDNVIYLGALPLEASHYFISKHKGVGLASATEFITLYKAFDQALSDAKKDASEIKDIEAQLNAAMQGMTLG